MNERAQAEATLVASAYPDLEVHSDGWARIPAYPIPGGLWTVEVAEVAFRFPENLPGEAPYAFWVRPPLVLRSGATVQNVTMASTPFGDGWQQFSWSTEPWQPGATPSDGSNMLHFVRSFATRLGEGG